MEKKFPIILIMGHTAVGKTNISIELKNNFPIEIISVDSSSIYRDMNIGTAKPNIDILNKFPHKLINIRDPCQNYSAFDFYNDSINIIKKSYINNKIPVFVGGSIFYFRTLLYGLSNFYKNDIYIIKNFIDKNLQKYNINNIIKNLNKSFLYNKNDINIKNIYKLKKTILILILQGFIKTKIIDLNKKYKIYNFFLVHNNNYEKIIEYRFIKMLKLGFKNEVKILYNRGDLNLQNQSIKSIGYKQMWLYFLSKISYNDMINYSIKSTLNLIKNQTKWIKKFKKNNIIVKNNKSDKLLITKISKIINNYF